MKKLTNLLITILSILVLVSNFRVNSNTNTIANTVAVNTNVDVNSTYVTYITYDGYIKSGYIVNEVVTMDNGYCTVTTTSTVYSDSLCLDSYGEVYVGGWLWNIQDSIANTTVTDNYTEYTMHTAMYIYILPILAIVEEEDNSTDTADTDDDEDTTNRVIVINISRLSVKGEDKCTANTEYVEQIAA